IYTDQLNTRKTPKSVRAALAAVDDYVGQRAPALFAPVIDYLREAGEARSCGEIEDHFQRHFAVSGVTTECEYLADQGLIGKAATPGPLTKKSNGPGQEVAILSLQGGTAG